jgi:Tol biopolymer transport system component
MTMRLAIVTALNGVQRRLVLAAVLGVSLVLVGVAISATNTSRGRNGLLLYQAQAGVNTQLFTIKPNGTGVRRITHFKDRSATDGNWNTRGSAIVFTQHWDPGGSNEHFLLTTINADGSGLRALPKAGSLAVNPNWFPDGRRIVFLDALGAHGGRLMVINADGTGLRSAGVSLGGPFSVCFLSAAKIAFIHEKLDGSASAIFVAGLFGHGVKRITTWGGYADKIDCSPDGKHIVFSKPEFGQDGKSANVFAVRSDGTNLVQLTHEAGGTVNAGANSWSPDGKQIAYVSNKSGTFEIWTMNADGSQQRRLTHAGDAHLSAWGSHR